MKQKKSDKANLEKKRFLFFEIGIITAVSLILISFEWSSSGFDLSSFDAIGEDIPLVEIPSTYREKPEVKPPAPPVAPEILQLVPNDTYLPGEIELEELTAGMETEVPMYTLGTSDEPEPDEDTIFLSVEDMPLFRGQKVDAFRIWVARHIHYPQMAAANDIQGKVFVRFVVEPDGRVDRVEVLRNVDPALDAEAVRVVSSSPRWTPGKQRGKPVRVAYTIPISFVLQ